MKKLPTILASLLFAGAASAVVPTLAEATVHDPPAGMRIRPDLPPPVRPGTIDRAKLRAKLAERRAIVFQRFLEYRERQVYPVNQLPGGGYRHVWLDDTGNLCAAATLLSLDWGRDAAIRAGAANNEIRLADVKTGAVADWMLTTGLTRGELVAIQVPGFDPCDGGGCNVVPEDEARQQEVTRMYNIYLDVERQLRSLWDDNLELATDALMKRPELARQLLADRLPIPTPPPAPKPTPTGGFAQPPPA